MAGSYAMPRGLYAAPTSTGVASISMPLWMSYATSGTSGEGGGEEGGEGAAAKAAEKGRAARRRSAVGRRRDAA